MGEMKQKMNHFYKFHPTLLPVVLMALLVIGCTTKKIERLKAKPHPTQQHIGFMRANTSRLYDPWQLVGGSSAVPEPVEGTAVETKPIRILVHPHKSRVCRAAVIL